MNHLIVVPVFNCEGVIDKVIESLIDGSFLPILVVDDGSDQPVSIPQSSRVNLLRFEQNRGKGVALKKAMDWAVEKNYSHILTFDGDGQHCADDVSKMIEASKVKPNAIVIGARKFDDSVPGISRFGRMFSNFWVKYQTGKKVSDSQSGLRVYPLKELATIDYFSKRYDFEIEVLVRGIWREHSLVEVDVGVIYPPEDERISHFDKFWDNARITILNIFLIFYSVFFYQRSLPKAAFAGVVGYSISLVASPISAVIIGLILCLLFRLNFLVMFGSFLILRFF